MKFYLSVIAFLSIVAAGFCQDVSVTVYNQNRAVVRDVRKLELKSGRTTVSFKDVAARIDPTTVHFRSVQNPDALQVLEQNFEYDLASSQTILDKYVDQFIRLYTEKGEYSGKLLSGAGDVVLQDSLGAVKVIQRDKVERFDFPKLPDGLITRPTLVWMVDNQGSAKQNVEVSYMTDGMNWHAEYVAVASSDDKSLDLSGWVSIENQSGIGYPNAKLKLVAGDVNIIQPVQEGMYRLQKLDVAASMAPTPQFEEKSFFEYHLYTLQRKATLQNNQTKQIALFPPAMTKAEKVFIYDGARNDKKINVRLEFKNSKAEGLGMPLPKGKVRVYQKDTDESLEFIGEDEIDHTPIDEKIRLSLGNAFDLTGERVQKDVRKTGDRSQEIAVEISLRNHKQEAVKITAVEHFWGDWKIKESNFPVVKKDARTAEFTIPVPAQKDTVLTYTAKIKW